MEKKYSNLLADLEDLIAQKVYEILRNDGLLESYEAINVREAAELCGVSKGTVQDLVNNCADTGFPAAKLGAKTFVVDRRGLMKWLVEGGLNRRSLKDDGSRDEPKLKAVK